MAIMISPVSVMMEFATAWRAVEHWIDRAAGRVQAHQNQQARDFQQAHPAVQTRFAHRPIQF